jgi:hypothetical protein
MCTEKVSQAIARRRFALDCESICFECAGKFFLKKMHEGVSLCFWCRVKEYFSSRSK